MASRSPSSRELGAEAQVDAELRRATLQDLSSFRRAMPLKPWPPDVIVTPLDVDVDVVPVREVVGDRRGTSRASAARKFSSVWSEKTTPQPNVSSARVALEDGDVVRRVRLLHQQGEVQPGRPAADHDDLHASLARSWDELGAFYPAFHRAS